MMGRMTVHFSSRVGSRILNPIARAELAAKAAGRPLGRLNDSNPTRHGLSSSEVPWTYTAEPRGPRHARVALAAHLSTLHAAERRALSRIGGGSTDGGVAGAGSDAARGDEAARIDPDDLYLLSSTSEAYSWLIKLLCDAGDAVLAPKPGYPLIESIAGLECVDAIEYQLLFDGSWIIDVAGIETLLDGPDGGRIRALVLINPNNPSGSYVKAGERERIVALCRDHGIALIADEVFFDYALEPFDDRSRLAGEAGVLTFALDGFSKMLAAPNAKVGWIQVSGPAADVGEAKRRLDVIADDYLPMSDIIAERMGALLGVADSQTERVLERVRGNLTLLHRLLDADESGLVSVLRAEGGWNVLLRFPSVIDENELVLRLIGDHGLTGQPGYFFDMPSNGYLAISLLPESNVFETQVRAVLATVDALLEG